MEINISIKHLGHAPGTVGWLAQHAHHILIGQTKKGGHGAWLKDAQGRNITILALRSKETEGSIALVERDTYCPFLACGISTTDAAWAVLRRIAELAANAMREDAGLAAGYKVSISA